MLKAALNPQGLPIAWTHRIVGPDHMAHRLPDLIPTILPYGVPRSVRNMAGALAGLALPRIIPGKKAAEGALLLFVESSMHRKKKIYVRKKGSG